jgi:crooked neck
VRILYERLLDRTKHVKVWLSYARFEADPLPLPEPEEGEEDDEETAARRAEEEGPDAAAGRAVRARQVRSRGWRGVGKARCWARPSASRP